MKQYGVILADPPWAYNNGGNGAAHNHYPTMTEAQIAAMPVEMVAAKDSVLILWSTWPQMAAALTVMGMWGFRYVTGFPWIKIRSIEINVHNGVPVDAMDVSFKPVYGTGFWVRGASECVLVGRRGHPRPPSTHPLGLLCHAAQHSRKPVDIYDYAESMDGPYLELFARRAYRGWDAWGNEVENPVPLWT